MKFTLGDKLKQYGLSLRTDMDKYSKFIKKTKKYNLSFFFFFLQHIHCQLITHTVKRGELIKFYILQFAQKYVEQQFWLEVFWFIKLIKHLPIKMEDFLLPIIPLIVLPLLLLILLYMSPIWVIMHFSCIFLKELQKMLYLHNCWAI